MHIAGVEFLNVQVLYFHLPCVMMTFKAETEKWVESRSGAGPGTGPGTGSTKSEYGSKENM